MPCNCFFVIMMSGSEKQTTVRVKKGQLQISGTGIILDKGTIRRVGEYEMQKIINRILEGNFDYEDGSLDFSCSKVEITLQKGELFEGSFQIFSAPGKFTTGMVTSSDLRMECLTTEFVGTEETISYRFHGEHLEEGQVVKGNFYIVSNQGEYYLPFVVSMEYAVLQSSVGAVKNLFHFANLAKSNWREAVELYYSPQFLKVFSGSDAKHLDLYRALSAHPNQEQNVEEFLIRMHKKQSVEYLVENEKIELESISVEYLSDVLEREISIIRNGWGYTCLQVACEGEFLFTEKKVLSDDDFLGNRCRLPIFIDGRLCRRGKNYGQVFLYNPYVCLTVSVVVKAGESPKSHSVELVKKQNLVQLMEWYQLFRLKKIGTSTWLRETGKLVEKMALQYEDDMTIRLFQAQLLVTEGRRNEAGWILDHVEELLEKEKEDSRQKSTLEAYYLYLSTLLHQEESYGNQAAAQVEQIYRKDETNWQVAWLLLYLSEEYHQSAQKKWQLLEKQYAFGCTSPVIYLEAVTLLNANPALLRKLGGFEQQVLYYGARKECLNQEVVEQMLYLTGKVKGFSPILFHILQKLYQRKADQRILQEICTLLVKGSRAGEKYFTWYRQGVEAQLRITNLYEHYMMSLDVNQSCRIPKGALLYFSYQNNMDYEHTAYLYDYVLQNQDKLGDLYETYRPKMERFIQEQIQKEHIGRHLANLYNKLLKPEMINGQTAQSLSRLLFANKIVVEDSRVKKIYVYQPNRLVPSEYLVTGRNTWIALYGTEYTIVFEDEKNNRFVQGVEYTLEKLMIPGKFIRQLIPYVENNIEFDLYLCENEKDEELESQESLYRAFRVIASRETAEAVKHRLTFQILDFYYQQDNKQALKQYLEEIPGDALSQEERALVVKYLVWCGNTKEASRWLAEYGPYFIDAKLLLRIVDTLIEQSGTEENDSLLAAAEYVFQKGKYDSTVLSYLSLHYQGLVKNMRDIWKAAKAFGAICYPLTERILVQILYSGAFVGEMMEILRDYVSQGGKAEIEKAFLTQCAREYFVRERVTEEYVFQEIRRFYDAAEPVQKIWRLAYLKYYAENPEEKNPADKELLEAFLQETIKEGIYMELFRKYKEFPGIQQLMADKTIIEYHASTGSRVSIHYVVLYENGEADEYREEAMQEIYGGVYYKKFTFFFGESVQYYITEEKDGEEQLTESGTLQNRETRESTDSGRYQLINDIVISRKMEDYDTMDNLLEEYFRNEFLNGRLFSVR